MSRAILVYLRGDDLLFVPLARVEMGGHQEVEPVLRCSVHDSPDVVGARVHEALELTCSKVVQATGRSPAETVVGAKSWREFTKGLSACDLELREGKGIAITPLLFQPGGGFEYDVDSAVSLPEVVETAEFAAVLIRVLTRSGGRREGSCG